MNQLFLKIKTKRFNFLLIILSFCNVILANDSIPKNSFLEYCRKSDAYLLYSYTDVSYIENWGGYKRQFSVQSKLVVNNKSGVEQFAFLNVNEYLRNHLDKISIKTLKADGTVVDLDSSLIFSEHIKENRYGKISYPIPGVEPGDTIETYFEYTENLNSSELCDFVNLYSSVPGLKIEYTVRTLPSLTVNYKSYNGFPQPLVLSNDTIIYVQFMMENIMGIAENQYTCLPCELPYVYYSVNEKKDETRTWKDVYNLGFNAITQPIRLDIEKSSYYRKWKKEIIGEAEDSSKYYKFNLLYQDILDNYKIKPTDNGEMIKSSGFFLKEKHFDPISLRRLYRQILEDLEIKYWAVFARSKHTGVIDPYYIRKGEFDHIFFAYENSDGTLSLLYPHDIEYKYQINEIPTALYNTSAIIAKPFLTEKIKKSDKFINYNLKLAQVDSVIVNEIKLPGMSPANNFFKQLFYCDVDLNEKKATFKSRFTASGGLSTDLRTFFAKLNQNKEASDFYGALAEYEGDKSDLAIDSLIKINLSKARPFVYSIDAVGTLKNSLTFLNDSLISISLSNLIQNSLIESDKDSIDLNYYLDYSHSDLFMVNLIFHSNIEVMGIDDYYKNLKNNVGEYLFSINQVGNNQMSIQSNYRIIKDMISKVEYGQLKQLNDLMKEIKNIRLLVKIKK